MTKRYLGLSLTFLVMFALATVSSGSAAALQATAAPTMPAITKQIKIALIAPSAKNDLAWTQSMYDALVAVQKEAGGKDKLDFTVSENLYQVPDAAAAMRDYATQGYDIVIAHGTQYGASMFDVAKDFSDVSFAWGTATDTGAGQGLKNVFAYEARAEEGGYVNGVMASLLTKSGIVGVVGPVEAGDAKLYIDGFEQGVKSTGKLKDGGYKKIYTNNFGDTALAAQAAQTLISQGADVLTGSAQQVPGAITEIQKVKGYWFGTQSDQTGNWPDTVVSSQVYDWSNVVKQIIALRLSGTKGGKAFSISLKDGGEKIVFNPKITIPDAVKQAAQSATNDIESGKVVVVGNPSLATPAPTGTPAG
ncbi:MAG TPA: BMP family protein [Aggregatilineales bacterium]|nr:BMP family protein [Aggregatilineales bacterium]